MLFLGLLERNDRLMWISVDCRQVLQGSFEILNSKKYQIFEEPKYVKSYLMKQHRCFRGIFESYGVNCGPISKGNSQLDEGLPTRIIQAENQEQVDLFDSWSNSIKASIEEQLKSGWSSEDIAVIIQVTDHDDVLLYLHVKTKCPDNQVYFQMETLSQEWPVVITCIPHKSLLNSWAGYLPYSRAVSKLVVVVKPKGKCETPSYDNYQKMLFEILKPCTSIIGQPILPQIEMIGFHQMIHQKNSSEVVSHVKTNISSMCVFLNHWLKIFSKNIDLELTNVSLLQNP